MSNSLPSTPVVIVDVPEVDDLTATFVYRFFTTDESINDDQSTLKTNVLDNNSNVFDITRKTPRYVVLRFTPPDIRSNVRGNEFKLSNDENDIDIAKNITLPQSEISFSNDSYTGLEFQDNNIDEKLYTLVSGSIAKRVAARNRSIQNTITQNRNDVIANILDEHSFLDAAKALASDTSDAVSNNMIVNALNQIDRLKLSIVDEEGQNELIDNTLETVRDVAVKTQISNKLISTIINNVIADPMSQFSDEFISLKPRARAVQEAKVGRTNSSTITLDEFQPSMRSFSLSTIDMYDQPSESKIIGYIIEKHELGELGLIKKPPIVIQGSSISRIIDEDVAYGKKYYYSIKTIAQISMQAIEGVSGANVRSLGLISSRVKKRAFVDCIENIPPPPPAELIALWKYDINHPMLFWKFPVNTQRDIKRFQVFRRQTVAEPFTLLKEIDFDDAEVRYESGETIPSDDVIKVDSPITIYIDDEFTRTSKWIYAVCAVDAHGMSSNYSQQIEVQFDQFKNKIQQTIIADQDAPKAYPNMTILSDLFLDSAKSSNASKLTIVFDPDALHATDEKMNDKKLLAFDDNTGSNAYKLQIINVNSQKQEVVTIRIKDRR